MDLLTEKLSPARDGLLCAILPGPASAGALERLRAALPAESWHPSRSALPPLLPLSWLPAPPPDGAWMGCLNALPPSLSLSPPEALSGSWIAAAAETESLDRARALLRPAGDSGPRPFEAANGFWFGIAPSGARSLGGSSAGSPVRVGALRLCLLSFRHGEDFWAGAAWEILRRSWIGKGRAPRSV